uniref:Exportin-7/Ran-binding protein 17 TPR repeats domain-containing protein n=1 Tax=Ditylenchus dipsaci TaxID=166011 RepID=A0A915EK65_9BILA
MRGAFSCQLFIVDVESIAESVPQVCAALIQSMILLCELVVRECVEDPLDDVGTLKQLMELFTIVSRRDYKRTAQELISLFDENNNIGKQQSKDSAGSFGGPQETHLDHNNDGRRCEWQKQSLFLLTEVLCSLDEPEKGKHGT